MCTITLNLDLICKFQLILCIEKKGGKEIEIVVKKLSIFFLLIHYTLTSYTYPYEFE